MSAPRIAVRIIAVRIIAVRICAKTQSISWFDKSLHTSASLFNNSSYDACCFTASLAIVSKSSLESLYIFGLIRKRFYYILYIQTTHLINVKQIFNSTQHQKERKHHTSDVLSINAPIQSTNFDTSSNLQPCSICMISSRLVHFVSACFMSCVRVHIFCNSNNSAQSGPALRPSALS
jgi:hypothetical protein